MNTYLRHATVAFFVAAGAGTANAQTVLAPEYYGAQTVVAQPLQLTPAQRTIIYRTIIPRSRGRAPVITERIVTEPVAPVPAVRERVIVQEPVAQDAFAAATTDYVGTRLTQTVAPAPIPAPVIASIPAVQSYRYVVVNNHVLLVDPTTGLVVADLSGY